MSNNQCPDCGSEEFDKSFDELNAVCNECGYVLLENTETNKKPANRTVRSSEVIIEEENQRPDWSDVHTVSNSTEKQVAIALETVEEIADKLALSLDSRETAARIYSQAAKDQITDGRSTKIVIAATLYIGSRKNGEPRPLTNVAEAVSVEKSKIDRTARLLQRELGIKQPICEAEEYLPYLRNKMDVEQDIEDRAREVLHEVASTSDFGGKSPVGFAGAALYLATDGRISQREIARIVGVTKETIRVRLNDIREEI